MRGGEELDPGNVIVVVRSAGERTVDACCELLLSQVPAERMQVVREVPFEAALKRCLEIGIESSAEWMVTVDADVLPRPGAIHDLIAEAKGLPPRVFQMEGLVSDKAWDGYRYAGNRIYRTCYLNEALVEIPIDGRAIRPETAMLQGMSSRGRVSVSGKVVFGVHDHEQFYRDIYRKSFTQGQKFREWLCDRVPAWRDRANHDPDFRVAARGFCDGYLSQGVARVDVRTLVTEAERCIREANLVEKAALPSDRTTLDRIRHDLLEGIDPVLSASPDSRRWKLRRLLREVGILRSLPVLVGSAMVRGGERLRRSVVPG